MHSSLALRSLALLLFATLTTAFIPNAPAQDPLDEQAVKLAKQITTAGATLMEKGDGPALAAQYVDDGEIIQKSIDSTGFPSILIHKGMDNIRKIYESAQALSRMAPVNEVHYARLISPDVLYITGDLLLTADGKTTRLPFSQIRKKIDNSWKIVSLELTIRK